MSLQSMDIYVGNLSYDTTDSRLNDSFAGFGEVTRATVIKDRDTGRSRGFGFVEIADADQARAAVEALNGTELDGRVITVNEARPRSESRPRSGGGGGGGYGGGGGRY
jgi:cold-inducible RNA-binding protein